MSWTQGLLLFILLFVLTTLIYLVFLPKFPFADAGVSAGRLDLTQMLAGGLMGSTVLFGLVVSVGFLVRRARGIA